MTWATSHPDALRVDPDEGRPKLVGSRWERKTFEDDVFDLIEIRGVFDLGNDHGGLELVVSPVAFGPALTTTPDSLVEYYRRVEVEPDPVEDLQSRVRDLEARAR